MLGLLTKGWGLLKGGSTIALVGGAGAAAYGAQDLARNGKDGTVGGLVEDVVAGFGSAAAEANQEVTFTNFYAFIEQIGHLLMNLTGGKYGSGLVNWAQDTKTRGEEPVETSPETLASETDTPDTPTVERAGLTATGNVITADNALTIENLTDVSMEDVTVGSIWNKFNIFSAGLIDGTINTVAYASGQVVDLGDWAVGGVAEMAGYDTGYKSRDLSATFSNATDENFNFDPELVTAWDRVAYGAGDLATYAIPGGAVKLGIAGSKAATLGTAAVAAYDLQGGP